ncbi:MAG: hypothetical protein ACKVPX_07415 [Myxococcaceae bacterium]
MTALMPAGLSRLAPLARSAPGIVSRAAGTPGLWKVFERSVLTAIGASPWLVTYLNSLDSGGPKILRTILDIHAEAPLRLYTPGNGEDPQVVYADGTPAFTKLRPGALKYNVDAGTDHLIQSWCKHYVNYRRAQAEALKDNPDPSDMLVTDIGKIIADCVDTFPAEVAVPLDLFLRGAAKYTREITGFFAAIAGLFRGLEVLSIHFPAFRGERFSAVEAQLREMLKTRVATPESGWLPCLLQKMADGGEKIALDVDVSRGLWDGVRLLPGLMRNISGMKARGEDYTSQARKAIALWAQPLFAFAGDLMGDEAGRLLRGAGKLLSALSLRHETRTKTMKFAGEIKRGLRAAQAVTWAFYPRIIRTAEAYVASLPDNQRPSAYGWLNGITGLLMPDRGIYKEIDIGTQHHEGMGPDGRPFVHTQRELWGLDQQMREALEAKDPATLTPEEKKELAREVQSYQKYILRADVHPMPEGLIGDLFRFLKASSMDKNSWDVPLAGLNWLKAQLEAINAPQFLTNKVVETLLVAFKASVGFKDPYDGAAFRRVDPTSIDSFVAKRDESGRVFVEDKKGDLHMTTARVTAMQAETVKAIVMSLWKGPEAMRKIVSEYAPDHRPARPGERITLAQNAEAAVTTEAALRNGGFIPWWRACFDWASIAAKYNGYPAMAKHLSVIGDLPYFTLQAQLTPT